MNNLFAFVVRRILQGIAVLVVVAFVAFTLFQFVGDPVQSMVGQDATPEERAALREALGLDAPVPVQFARFLGRAVQGEFGLSYQQGRPVATMLAERFPATMELSFVAALIALALGIPAGVYTALRRGHASAGWLLSASLVGVSLPTFLTGILLILVFSVQLGWLPSYGRGPTVRLGGWDTALLSPEGWKHIILPACTLGLFQMTLVMRLVRAEMLEVLRTDYIRFARARGLTNRAIHFRHALRNTLIPVITIAGLQIGSIIGFSIITEQVFQWPGMGLLFLQAIQSTDIPVLSAYLCLVAVVFVSINLVVDILYAQIDPRLRVRAHG